MDKRAGRPAYTRVVAEAVVGGTLGGLAASVLVVAVTSTIKAMLAWVVDQDSWVILTAPFVGIVAAVLLLNRVADGRAAQRADRAGAPPRRFSAWLRFPANAVRADLTADVVHSAGHEETFPSRLAPIRALAIVTTVGLGAPMGTESPAAHLGVAAGSAAGGLGRHEWLRRLARPGGVGGGAAGVAVLMGLPLVGLAFILELGRRSQAPVSLPRVLAATSGALTGWAINSLLELSLIRLIVPVTPPNSVLQAIWAAVVVGALAGAVSSAAGAAIYQARGWQAGLVTKLLVGSAALLACLLLISVIATPAAAIGPGAGAITWAETAQASAGVLLLVAMLRALATTAAVMAGGCGGLFVPLLSIGDLCGRALAPGLGVSPDLAASAGAAGGVAGGYRLPLTAVAMVLTVGGPLSARLTCAATVLCAVGAAIPVSYLLDRYVLHRATTPPVPPAEPSATESPRHG
ncbi:chloride channel core [Gordonia pseudamarae]|uniref:Chloride channel core n=1 Tax=Gordonia pseudamarae TaxID=2831662 RepID=A0ABX6IM98_9ACTN|nr:chloride channel protein [Gordonia pseudamarae]QHN28186.1 chloride channel core [Gordonia pseudamarae]QHN37047.1 chloride channel core [Gordonia pseudamarae]